MEKKRKLLKIASSPQDGKIPTRLFYNRPYDNPEMFIKDKQMIEDSKKRFKGLTGIDLANLADGRPDETIMNYVTEKGFFLDGQGKAYQQRGGKFGAPTEYNPDKHGLPVPLVNRKKLKIGTA